jgi:hypothetical protein
MTDPLRDDALKLLEDPTRPASEALIRYGRHHKLLQDHHWQFSQNCPEEKLPPARERFRVEMNARILFHFFGYDPATKKLVVRKLKPERADPVVRSSPPDYNNLTPFLPESSEAARREILAQRRVSTEEALAQMERIRQPALRRHDFLLESILHLRELVRSETSPQ